MTTPQPRAPRQAPEAPWWDHPHDIRTLGQCTATLTPDPRTQCTRRTHPTTTNNPDSWHTWGAVTWGTTPPDHMTRTVTTTHHDRTDT